MSPKVLIVTESSSMNSGYGTYAKHIISGLHNAGIEIAELSIGINKAFTAISNTPWKVYPNLPDDGTPQKDVYNSSPGAEYGSWQFEAVLLDFKPTHVLDWRDCWHFEYQLRSPLRKYFAHIAMIPVDSEPQHKQWLDLYQQSDAILCYTQWGLDLMKSSNPKINTVGIAPPYAHKLYVPNSNRKELKNKLNLGDIKIIGMVGRNQKRKLFPNLFKAFSNFLKITKRNDMYLYCHTSYPDRGWELDEEIMKYGIQNRTLFSYICKKCANMEIGLFQGGLTTCYHCGTRNKVMCSVEAGFDHNQMADAYNVMDLYVQWASCEGYGMPLMEAIACSTPSVAVDYSAMTEVTKLGGGKLIKPVDFSQEIESGRMFAIPDDNELTKYFSHFFSLPEQMRVIERNKTRKNYEKNWHPERVIQTWIDAINSTKPKLSWNSPKINYNATTPPDNLSNENFVRWLIANVLCEPERVGTWLETRLLRDLDWEMSPGGMGGVYLNELSATQVVTKYTPFNRIIALEHFTGLMNIKNFWEDERVKSL
jgi:glycosyltransferase involved in cell wall biosynthesis